MKKIVAVVVATIISAFLGLFILPRKVETKRWIEVDASKEAVWSLISSSNELVELMTESDTSTWDGGRFVISTVDDSDFELHFTVGDGLSEGNFTMEERPDALWLGCYYSYEAAYAPWGRLVDWLHRGEMALQIDQRLLKIKQKVEQQEP